MSSAVLGHLILGIMAVNAVYFLDTMLVGGRSAVVGFIINLTNFPDFKTVMI